MFPLQILHPTSHIAHDVPFIHSQPVHGQFFCSFQGSWLMAHGSWPHSFTSHSLRLLRFRSRSFARSFVHVPSNQIRSRRVPPYPIPSHLGTSHLIWCGLPWSDPGDTNMNMNMNMHRLEYRRISYPPNRTLDRHKSERARDRDLALTPTSTSDRVQFDFSFLSSLFFPSYFLSSSVTQ